MKLYFLVQDPRENHDLNPFVAFALSKEALRPAVVAYLEKYNIVPGGNDHEYGDWSSLKTFSKWQEGKDVDELLTLNQFSCDIPYIDEVEIDLNDSGVQLPQYGNLLEDRIKELTSLCTL